MVGYCWVVTLINRMDKVRAAVILSHGRIYEDNLLVLI